MTAADRLDAIEARANAATAGPWEAEGAEVFTVGHGMFGGMVATVYYGAETGGHHPAADRSFILSARQDVPALVAALRAVLALHVDAGQSQGFTRDARGGYGDIDHCCGECGSFGEYGQEWPCPTVTAITTALGAAS